MVLSFISMLDHYLAKELHQLFKVLLVVIQSFFIQ
jgi:hypothetical protein